MLLWILYALGAEYIAPAIEGESLQAYIAAHPRMLDESLHSQALNYILNIKIVESLGDITQTLFFLIGAMTIVELSTYTEEIHRPDRQHHHHPQEALASVGALHY